MQTDGIYDKIKVCNLSDNECAKKFKSVGGEGVPMFCKDSACVTGYQTDMDSLANKLGLKKYVFLYKLI